MEKTSDQIRQMLDGEQIESRPIWKPMHLQPVYADCPYVGNGVSDQLFKTGLCLPSGVGLTTEDIKRIVKVILSEYNHLDKNQMERQKDINIRYRPEKAVESKRQPKWIQQYIQNNFFFARVFNFLF